MSVGTPESSLAPPLVPGGLPLLGHALKLVRSPLEFLRQVQSVGDIAIVRLGTIKAYYVGRPEYLRSMLMTEATNYDKGVHYEKSKLVIGNGLPASDGAFHRQQRRMIRPAFQKAKLRGYFDVMVDCTKARVDSWPTEAAEQVDVGTELHALAATIAAKALASTDMANSVADELGAYVKVLADGVNLRVLDPTGLVAKLPIPANRRFERTRARVREIFDELIQDYRREDIQSSDLLSILLLARDPESGIGMTDEQLRDEVVSLLLAGLETTAQTLKWLSYALADHPEEQDLARQEIEGVLGGRPVGFDDLDQLPYTRRVVTEILRMYPPLYFLSRRPKTDVDFDGTVIPAGSMVLFSPYAVQHDPRFFPDPHRFHPDRWLTAAPEDRPSVSYLPFGAGIRSCVGDQFAIIEIIAILCEVLPRYTLRRKPSVQVRPKASFVLAPNDTGVLLESRGPRG